MPFDIIWLRWLFLMLLGGSVLAVALYLGFYLPSRPTHPRDEGEEFEEYAAGIRQANRPIPPLLIMLFVGMAIFIIGYVVYVWLGGVTY